MSRSSQKTTYFFSLCQFLCVCVFLCIILVIRQMIRKSPIKGLRWASFTCVKNNFLFLSYIFTYCCLSNVCFWRKKISLHYLHVDCCFKQLGLMPLCSHSVSGCECVFVCRCLCIYKSWDCRDSSLSSLVSQSINRNLGLI